MSGGRHRLASDDPLARDLQTALRDAGLRGARVRRDGDAFVLRPMAGTIAVDIVERCKERGKLDEFADTWVACAFPKIRPTTADDVAAAVDSLLEDIARSYAGLYYETPDEGDEE